jgi:rod shape-determining protein MreD
MKNLGVIAKAAKLARAPFVMVISFAIAIILMLVSLPPEFNFLRPQFFVLTLLYWILYTPQRINFFLVWCLGMFLDVMYSMPLGTYALSLVLVTFITLNWQVRINFFALWQKLAVIFMLTVLYFMPRLCVEWMTKHDFNWWLYIISPLVSALLWPYVAALLDGVRRRFII